MKIRHPWHFHIIYVSSECYLICKKNMNCSDGFVLLFIVFESRIHDFYVDTS